MTVSRPTRRLVLVGALALAASVAGCGRKGALEPPGGTWSPPEGQINAKPPREPVRPQGPIILDSLLN